MGVKDSNGNIPNDGDAVTLTKELKVKGSSMMLKRGKLVRNIRLTDNPQEVDCRIEGSNVVLRTSYL